MIANLEHRRRVSGLTYKEVSDRSREIGRPIPALGLSRIEKGNRRVDVDDLVALAIVLESSPVELLEPRPEYADDDGLVQVTADLRMPARQAAEWMANLTLFPPNVPLPWPRSVTTKRVRESELADMRRRIEQLESLLESRKDGS
ncbi:MAG: helix-turn-helix domain-containing protein [Streptosporangiaceae bacterium]